MLGTCSACETTIEDGAALRTRVLHDKAPCPCCTCREGSAPYGVTLMTRRLGGGERLEFP
jgi:hypothetical protein